MNIVASLLLLLSALTYAASNGCDTVKTYGGGCCVFPFKYNGKKYCECITNSKNLNYPGHGPWCSLTPIWKGKKGYCLPEECGRRPIDTRIVGGTRAQNGSWPWMAMLAYAGGSHFCGGTLIKKQWVLTAAHCVDGLSPSQIVVRMGAYKITDIAQERQVDEILIHEKYNEFTREADIALLKLKKSLPPFGFGPFITGWACLPPRFLILTPEVKCYITGWGTLSDGGSQPEYLQEAQVQALSNAVCFESYGPDTIVGNMICAIPSLSDAFQGDSGGPLVCEFDGKWYLVGITSLEREPDRHRHVSRYTRVDKYAAWVKETAPC